jgi:hypothetical protein
MGAVDTTTGAAGGAGTAGADVTASLAAVAPMVVGVEMATGRLLM